jgi:Arc/MetJ family transcription regulator
MRTTLDLDPELLRQAQAATGLATKTAVIELGLKTLIDRASRGRLAALFGRIPEARAPRRRRQKLRPS